jgi:hypothetical protein
VRDEIAREDSDRRHRVDIQRKPSVSVPARPPSKPAPEPAETRPASVAPEAEAEPVAPEPPEAEAEPVAPEPPEAADSQDAAARDDEPAAVESSNTVASPSQRAITADAPSPESAEHWPAPKRPEPEYDPHDWTAEENRRATTESKEHTLPKPPPTRVTASTDVGSYRPIPVDPIPEVPEAGLFPAVRYVVSFTKANWQRRSAIKKLKSKIAESTSSLDEVLGRLGAEVRALEIREPALESENQAIDMAEKRRERSDHECAELSNRQAEENSKYAEIEQERQAKVAEAESILEKAENELGSNEAQRRSLRDKRKIIERKQKGYLKAAEEREASAEKEPLGDTRAELRKAAEDLRRDAAQLDPERQDIERRATALEKPISQSMAKVEALKAELDSARRSLNDAKEGHRLRLAEIVAEQGRKSRELAQAEAEIQRRLITLGTLVNLNRIERPEFDHHYGDIDKLRGAIGSRSNEIDRLTAEREAYDKGSIIRGLLVLGAIFVVLLTIIIIMVAAT